MRVMCSVRSHFVWQASLRAWKARGQSTAEAEPVSFVLLSRSLHPSRNRDAVNQLLLVWPFSVVSVVQEGDHSLFFSLDVSKIPKHSTPVSLRLHHVSKIWVQYLQVNVAVYGCSFCCGSHLHHCISGVVSAAQSECTSIRWREDVKEANQNVSSERSWGSSLKRLTKALWLLSCR